MKYSILFIFVIMTFNLNAQLFGGMAIAQSSNGYVYDIDGNAYEEVEIGTQIWLKPNLKTTKYNDGTTIPNVTDGATWSNLSTGAWAYYNNDASYNADYGKLYNWYAVEGDSLCPTGWHVPTYAEWTVLTDYLGGDNVADDKLKEVGTVHWSGTNTNATDEVGFTALPGGTRQFDGSFYGIRDNGHWWTATSYNSNVSWFLYMVYYFGSIEKSTTSKVLGKSVRCLKD